MILVLFLYVTDVFATQKQPHSQEPPLEYYYGDLPTGDPIHLDYGVTEFWWEDSTTRWLPWWEKMNVTIPEPRSVTETETTIETPKGANQTMPKAETTGQNETATQTDTTTRRFFSTTPAADGQRKTDADFPFPEIFDANLLAQLRAQQSLAAMSSSTQKLSSENTPDYDYYGELNNEIPPNVRGPEYPGLSPDIPVILKGNKTEKKRPPAIPGWRLQFPDQPTKKEELYDGTPKPEKTTFQVNNADYFDAINAGMIIEPLPAERAGISLQPNSGTEDSEKSTVIAYNSRSAMDYPGPQDKPAIPDSIDALGIYSPVPFKFDEVATGQAFMAQFSGAEREGMIKLPPTLKAVHALSPTYTVPQIEENDTPATRSINTWFTLKDPTTTTWFTTQPTTTTRLTTQPTTTTRFTTQPTTTTRIATQPATAATQPSTTTKLTSTTLGPDAPLTNYIQTYEVDWDIFSSSAPTVIQDAYTPLEIQMTTDHPVVAKLKIEMAKEKVGYFSVCFKKFFEIFSTKENNALKDLLKGGSNALEKMNENHDLEGLGRPMWPGTELGFLQMRMTPIEKVKSRAKIAYTFYSSGMVFNVKSLHRRIDNLYYKKEGEDMMQAIAEFKEYPGFNVDMDPSQIMEHLFRSLLAPYLRDKTSPKVLSVAKEINENLLKIRNTFFGGGGGRRNTPRKYKYTSTINYKLKNKVGNIENSNKGTIMDDNDYEERDDLSEIPINNSGDDYTNNAVQHKDEIDEANTIYDSYEDITPKKMESVTVMGNSNKKSMKTKDFVNDTYVRMSKVTDKGPRILFDSGKEKYTKKLNCYNDECTASNTNTVPKTKKYGQNKLRHRKAESKVRLLKDASEETSGLIGHHKETEMGYHDKIPKKFPKSYQNAKKAFKSSKNDHENGFLKDNKENNTNRARNGESSDEKMYLEIIKYNKSEPKRYHEIDNKIDYINSILQINRKTKYVKGNPKLNCYDNNDECTAADTIAVPKRVSRIKYGQNKEGYGNAESKVRPLTETKDRIHGHIGHHKEPEISYSVTQKVTQATSFHVKNGQKESKKYHTTYKKATKSSKKDVKNVKKSDKKWYLEVFKYNQLEPETNEEKDNKINDNNSKEKINGKTKYFRGTYEGGPILQTKGIKSKINKINDNNSKEKINGKTKYFRGTYEGILQTKGIKSKIKAQSKISDFSYKSTKKTYVYENYNDEKESKIRDKKENKVGINWKGRLSKNKDEDYDTFDDSVDSKEMEHGKTTTSHIKDVPANKNKNTSASQNSIKAKEYIKELRIRRTTREKEYFRDTKKYQTTTISSHGEKIQHRKIDKKYTRTENYKIWSSSEKVNPTQTISTYVTENEVPRYGNKKVLKDRNAPRSKKNKNNILQENFNSFENQLKNKHQENKLESHDNHLNAQKSKTNVKNTKNPINRNTNISERVLQKNFKHIQNPEAKNNEKHNSLTQSPKPLGVDIEAPDLKQKHQSLKNKKDDLLKHYNNNNSSYNKNSKIFWPHSKSQYIVKDDPYLKERFLDFNRDKTQNKTRYSLRNLHKSKNILRVESSYSDEEEVLKSNLQDNLLHGGRNFTDTLHKYRYNKIRDISSYSDEEDTLKKNIYKLFT